MIDVDEQINAERRTVGRRTFSAGEARTVTITRTYAADQADVWDACTNAERIPRWFLPITGDLRLHGHYQLEGHAGGTIESCDPPNGFTATWQYDDEVSWIEVRLAAEGPDRTRFELEHIAHVDDERWAEFGPGAVGVGWDLGLLGLVLHLASGEPVDPTEFAAWSASDDGRRFATMSARLWGEASVAAGDDPDAARAAVERTTAAYTGAESTDT
jgi:uncharacterized protein YndB with AHSA1/START domain